jgi:WD40 repeat protein
VAAVAQSGNDKNVCATQARFNAEPVVAGAQAVNQAKKADTADAVNKRAKRAMTEAQARLHKIMMAKKQAEIKRVEEQNKKLVHHQQMMVQQKMIAQQQLMAQQHMLAQQQMMAQQQIVALERTAQSQVYESELAAQVKFVEQQIRIAKEKMSGQIMAPPAVGSAAAAAVGTGARETAALAQVAGAGAGAASPAKVNKKAANAWRRRLARYEEGSSESPPAAAASPSSIMRAQVPSVDIAPPPEQSLLVGTALPPAHRINQWEDDPWKQPLPFKLSLPASVYGHGDECIYSCRFAPAPQQVAAGIIARKYAVAAGNSPDNVNATLLATTGQDGSARIWCVEGVQGEESIREVAVLRGHGNFECVRFCWGDGVTVRLAATTGADGTVALWDTIGQTVVERLPCGEKTQVYAGEFLGGQSTLVATAHDEIVSLWDVQHGPHQMRTWKFQSRKTMSAPKPLSKDSNECFVYGVHSMKTSSVSNGPNLFAVALSDGSACVVDLREGDPLPSLRWHAHERYVCEVSGGTNLGGADFSSNAIMTASGDGTVKLWDLRKLSGSEGGGGRDSSMGLPSEPMNMFAGHHGVVYGATFIANQSEESRGIVASWSADGTVRMWSALEDNPTKGHKILYENENMSMHGFAFGPSLNFAAVVGSPKGAAQHGRFGSAPARWQLFKSV